MNATVPTMNIPSPATRSTLVSGLGWIAIVLSALSLFSAMGQLAFFNSLAEAPLAGVDPALQGAASRSLTGMLVLYVALAGFVMYAGYALWKRRNWARRTFIVLFALGIAANVIWVALSTLFGSLFAQLGGGGVFGAIFGVLAIFALGVAALFFWFIKRLRSPAVKSEFVD